MALPGVIINIFCVGPLSSLAIRLQKLGNKMLPLIVDEVFK